MNGAWQATDSQVTLSGKNCAGYIDLAQTPPGIHSLCLSSCQRVLPGPVLAISGIQARGRAAGATRVHRTESPRVRQASIDLRLAAPPAWNVELEAVWRIEDQGRLRVEASASARVEYRAFEMMTVSRISEVTEALLAAGSPERPHWITLNPGLLPARSVWVAPRDPQAATLSLDGRSPTVHRIVLGPRFSLAVIVLRCKKLDWSYVEIGHPEDCTRILIRPGRRTWEVGTCLFGQDIEKGVIMRGRVHATWVERRDDLEQARELYRAIQDSALPLSS